jgi:hypothetical protein
MITWEGEEIMEEKKVDQIDNINLEDTEVTTSNAPFLSSWEIWGEPIPKHSEIWERIGAIQQPRQRSICTRDMKVQQKSESGGRACDKEQYQGQSRAYVQKSVHTSSGGVSVGQNKVANERTTVSATTAAASSGTTQQVQLGSSSGIELAGRKVTMSDNLLYNKCEKKGHIFKDCTEDIEYVCGKGHQSMRCAWL